MDSISGSGRALLPAEQIKLFSPKEWEEFVLEWIEVLRGNYFQIDKLGGAGDKGRDVVAYYAKPSPTAKWDNYQCKHYDHPLAPSDIWTELGKLCLYTFRKDYPIPASYRFVAPQGVGIKLQDFLANPDKLKAELIANWGKGCETKIEAAPVKLTANFKTHVENFDFSIAGYIPVNDLIRQ